MTNINLKKFFAIFVAVLFAANLNAQIYEPEGINMPGDWDGWSNPPTNMAFASQGQTGGNVQLVSGLGTANYQTIFSTPTDVAAGSYTFVYSSGPAGNYWANKWTDAAFSANSVASLTLNGSVDNTITLADNKVYVMNFADNGYGATQAVFMELDAMPVAITDVSRDISVPSSGQDVTVTVTTDANPSENIYVRYTTNDWTSSSLVACNFSGTSGTAVIPGQSQGTTVEYYVFSTAVSNPTADFDVLTIDFDNNNGSRYSYSVPEELTCEGASGMVVSDPVFPIHDQSVTITFDASLGNGALFNYDGDVYGHMGVITSESNGNNDWLYVVSEWGVNDAEFGFTEIGTNLYELTIDNVRSFFGVPAGEEIYKIAMVIRADEPIDPEDPNNFLVARNADGSDIHVPIYTEGLNVKIVGSLEKDPLVPLNTQIPVCVYALDATSIDLEIDGSNVSSTGDLEMMYGLNTGDYSAGMHEIVSIASDGTEFAYDTTWFYIRGDVVVQDLPAGVQKGINYIDDNTVTLVLHDPSIDKEYAFVIGDFNNWTASDEGYMKRTPDGTHFWTTITGLEPGVEYAYQYYLDGYQKLADPYSEKILDPWNDRWIPETTYPDLKPYPWDKTLGVVSVLQTAEEEYEWVVENFVPDAVGANQSNLIVYELLIRDFVESRDIKDVIDTLDYLQNLGVTAIELMPIAEFDGNDSWGYAPNFYFATDKAYGTKNDYKRFIDECHQRGIAVILDVVYNHMYGGSPLVQMYWDSENNNVAANSAWFNQIATHPYSIGYDFNHESGHTRELVKRNLEFWLTEFKFDGFRFDLSKGFTQTNSGGDIGVWSAYDQSRIDIIFDYKNHVHSVNPNAYFILEHFADGSEEVVLANGGCLLWGVMTHEFSQASMGWESDHDFSYANYQNRGFAYPNLIPFMESHDEERIMYQNFAYGNGIAGDLAASLYKAETAAVMYLTIPGPKMIWQFGELGYDESIFLCWDGSFQDDCRTSSKPIHWEYTNDFYRQKLFWTYAGMIKLKKESEAFRFGSYTQDLGNMGKRMWIAHESMNVVVSGNFASYGFDMTPGFQHAGTWYNYFTGESFDVSDPAGHLVYYNSGDYTVYTDVQMPRPYATLTFNVTNTNGDNIEDAEVTILGYSSNVTDASGNLNFLYGTNRTLDYVVTADGYNSASGTVSFGENDQTEYVVLDIDLAVGEVAKKEIGIFPNPATNFVTVKSNQLYKISVYNITGSKVKQFEMTSLQQTFDLSDLTTGVYTLLFENDKEIRTEKIIIQ